MTPGNTSEQNARRGASVSAQLRDVAAWDRVHPERPDPEVFHREILPGLVGLSSLDLGRLMGVSFAYAAKILRGDKVPHPRHWERLRDVGNTSR